MTKELTLRVTDLERKAIAFCKEKEITFPIANYLVEFAKEETKDLQEKNKQLEELLAEQYPDLKQSLDWANEREKELLEQIVDLKDYVLKVSKFLHNNNNVRPDKLVYKERDILLIKELKLFEKWEQK